MSTGKVTVTGTMDANRLVDYVYRRTKKQAKVVPQPEPEKPPEEAKPADGQKEEKPAAEEAKPEEKKEEAPAPAENKDGGEKPAEEQKKEGGDAEAKPAEGENKEQAKSSEGGGENYNIMSEEQNMQKMIYYYQPLYVMERIPPPQLFSDENPNACCIT